MDDGAEEVKQMPDFEEVYRRYFADVYKYVLALSRDEAVAEEVTQETFFKALTAIDGFRGDCQLRVWLCQIARNQYLTLCREMAASKRASRTGMPPGGSTGCSTSCRSLTRRCFPCGPSGSCPSPRSGSCSARRRAGPG